ncbi:hypothetical protein HYPSUDRAFT_192655 [Hypholoma sublateritium FD-334 SS-4]|uniref:Epoxide hydrolase N-terminal domain-containing protein n=1 Tax=Hypholoma sublateritium (strain FD-334 SS-4) TaxID=945553 RepID=A0A0D2NK19_HYPSF|nr:hypothetical protein HYPSUDRAFT_192655 [Hypholoma sublateritium FD-334 SS-4]
MQSFKIEVRDEQLERLKQKLALAILPDELEDAGWTYGVPLAEVRRLLARWQDGYDWRTHEAILNADLPQFQTEIAVDGFESLKIHFVHKQSEVTGAIPLLFVHGWPGGFFEARKLLPLLTQATPDQPSFHIVAYSLPGYGFSEAPKKKGFTLSQYAEVGHKLMLALGYNEYVVQGGDWGGRITQHIASLYGGKHCKARHTNWPDVDSVPPTLSKSPLKYLRYSVTPYTAAEKAGLERTAWFRKEGMGYNNEHSTQPQTIGYSLADSPVGLLAWIYEKLVNWTDAYKWDDDEVLTWVSIYWFSTAGPAASVRIYYEHTHNKGTVKLPTVPNGVSYFPKELIIPPRSWTNSPYTVFQSQHDSGGHFAAHEKPEELVSDLRKMFGKGGPAFGVVKDSPGY